MTQPGTDPPQELAADAAKRSSARPRSGDQDARVGRANPGDGVAPALALVALSVAMRPMVIVPAAVLDGVACCGRAPPPTCGDRAVS